MRIIDFQRHLMFRGCFSNGFNIYLIFRISGMAYYMHIAAGDSGDHRLCIGRFVMWRKTGS